jgi:cytochrome P450
MAEVIGIPMPLRTDFDSWTRAVGDAGKMGTSAWSADVAREAVRSLNSINLLVDELVGSQANVPSGSIISFAQRDAGSVDSLTLRELAANVRSIFRAGVDTTQYLIASVAYLIFSQDSVLRELRAEPENVTRVVQEVLRFACPAVEIPVRRANQDILIGGEMIKRGELVRIVTLKAERDPRRYPRPNIFDYRRAAPVRPLTYGVGPHTCLGNLFATTIAEEVGRALVDPKYGARLHSPTPKFRRRTTAPVIWGPEWVNIEFAGH